MAEAQIQLAIGDTTTIALPRDATGFVVAQIDYQASAVAYTGVLEVSNDDGVSYATPVKMHDPVVGELGAEIASLTTDNQIGWIRNPGYTHARVRCTAFTTPGSGVRVSLRAPAET